MLLLVLGSGTFLVIMHSMNVGGLNQKGFDQTGILVIDQTNIPPFILRPSWEEKRAASILHVYGQSIL